jgi:predicted nucleic acid-binding protein
VTGRLLLDNSAWARLGHGTLRADRAAEVADALEAGRIAVCAPFLLEAGYSARDAREHADLVAELLALPYLAIDRAVQGRAVDAQAQLARAGHHRLPPVDILVAAIAERHDHGVLHYDGDYDVIRARTDLRFESVWLAERGAL